MSGAVRISVGTTWTDTTGREWRVYEVLPFGKARVRSGMRFGEMRFSDIRAAKAKGGVA